MESQVFASGSFDQTVQAGERWRLWQMLLHFIARKSALKDTTLLMGIADVRRA